MQDPDAAFLAAIHARSTDITRTLEEALARQGVSLVEAKDGTRKYLRPPIALAFARWETNHTSPTSGQIYTWHHAAAVYATERETPAAVRILRHTYASDPANLPPGPAELWQRTGLPERDEAAHTASYRGAALELPPAILAALAAPKP
jgi:hypothetical protein